MTLANHDVTGVLFSTSELPCSDQERAVVSCLAFLPGSWKVPSLNKELLSGAAPQNRAARYVSLCMKKEGILEVIW